MNPLKEKLLEEFDEKFVASITSSPGNIEHARAVIFFEDQLKIKSFLSSTLDQMLDAAIGAVPEEMATNESKMKMLSWNACRTETLKNLSALKSGNDRAQ